MDYVNWYKMEIDPAELYAQVAQELEGAEDPKAHARTLNADESLSGEARAALAEVPADIEAAFPEFGAPMPPLMEGCTVVDLCCGSGRDAFLAAKLVGATGHVIGVTPHAEKLALARRAADEAGIDNVEFVQAVPENLSAIADGIADIVISNCTFNLSPDKVAYVREVERILKQDGEWYFTDVFTDRRIPQKLAKDVSRRADRLAGALFVGDFRRLAQRNGFNDPRYVIHVNTPLAADEQAVYGDVKFATLTVRAMKSDWSEDVCESYGETVCYDGSLPDFPDFFLFEHNIKFPAGKQCEVCGNVTTIAEHSRYAKVFTVTGDRTTHKGDTHHTFDVLFE